MIDIEKLLITLARNRPIFHSEADFQHALAWEIHKLHPDYQVRLEYPTRFEFQVFHVDIMLLGAAEIIAIELKYKTRAITVELPNEVYKLQSQSAQDLGRYDYLKDIARLETICKSQNNTKGISIFLSNDSAYWKKPTNFNTIDKDFRIHQGKYAQGACNWGINASKGTVKNREKTINLLNEYFFEWKKYSSFGSRTWSEFYINTILINT